MNPISDNLRKALQLLFAASLTAFGASGTALAADPVISVTWDENPQPAENFDYEIDATNPAFPNVELISPSLTWRVWSTDTDNPNDIGDIGVITSPYPENFGVKIADDQGGPGAREVKGINLNPTSNHHSSLTAGSHISGDLTGPLMVVANSWGTGGEIVELEIDGDASGDITAREVTDLQIDGDVSGDVTTELLTTLTIGGGGLYILGDVTGDITVSDKMEGANIKLHASVSGSTITINDMVSSAIRDCVVGLNTNGGDTTGTLVLGHGIRADQVVVIYGQFSGDSSSINLTGDDVAGDLSLFEGGACDILNGGAVSGSVTLALDSHDIWSGTASFSSVTSSGELTVGKLDSAGTLVVEGEIAGSIEILGDAVGDVITDNDLTGTVDVGGDLTGDVYVAGDASGSIDVGGELGTLGRIIVYGLCTGAVTIDGGTQANSLIQMVDGLGSGGQLKITAGIPAQEDDGVIYIGSPTAGYPLPAVTFDGCIDITGNRLNDITVRGCHATSDDLDICISGTMSGEINIEQRGCTNQVEASCLGGCE